MLCNVFGIKTVYSTYCDYSAVHENNNILIIYGHAAWHILHCSLKTAVDGRACDCASINEQLYYVHIGTYIYVVQCTFHFLKLEYLLQIIRYTQ